MANTPFELYEEAYRLHYRDKKIPDAVTMYEAIIREFPDSSECGYAFIQLQKIKANAVTAGLRRSGGNSLAIVACFVGCTALIIAAGGIIGAFHELRAEHNRTTFAIATLAEMQAGKNQEARKILDEMGKRYPNDILARELSLCVASGGSLPGRNSAGDMAVSDSSAKPPSVMDKGTGFGETPAKKSPSAPVAKWVSRARPSRPDTHAPAPGIIPATAPADTFPR